MQGDFDTYMYMFTVAAIYVYGGARLRHRHDQMGRADDDADCLSVCECQHGGDMRPPGAAAKSNCVV